MRFIMLVCLGLTGCGAYSREVAKWTLYNKVCVEGVSYIQFPSGASPDMTLDGKIKACK